MNTTTMPQSSNSVQSNPFSIRTLLHTLIRTENAISPAALRLSLAVVMFPHGAQKLLGWFGGYGFNGTMGFFTNNMNIPWILAFGTIMVEFFAPIMLLLGVGTRLAALSIGVVMTTAMFMVHLQYGFFMNWFGNQQGEGIEYFLLIIGMTLALTISGGGRWSIDRSIRPH